MNLKCYLAIENDAEIHERESKVWLSTYGVSSVRVSTMNEGIEKAMNNQFLYVVINASNINYMPTLRLLREVTNTPILIASSSYTVAEQALALERGADLFGQLSNVTSENIQSVTALLNRLNERFAEPKPLVTLIFYQNILMSPTHRQVFLGDDELELTKIEFDVLLFLINNRGYALSFNQIYTDVWGQSYENPSNEIVKSAIKRLRKKIITKADFIENLHGFGYRLK